MHAAIPLPHSARARWFVGALIAVWFFVVAGGWWSAKRYEFSVNAPLSHGIVTSWPAESALVRSDRRPTLLLFLHPKCPCSRATMNELSRLLAATNATKAIAPRLLVVATVPTAANDAWWDTDTVAQSKQIGQSTLFVDRGGREAARFGATTSGTVMLFDESGRRRYAGGITVSRGHEGPNAGSDCLVDLLGGKAGRTSDLPVFGCRLCLPDPEIHNEPVVENRHAGRHSRSSL